jgi:hypothetical protein
VSRACARAGSVAERIAENRGWSARDDEQRRARDEERFDEA